MRFFRRNPGQAQPATPLAFVETAPLGPPAAQPLLREGWIACRLYVPTSTLRRSLGGVVVQFSPAGVLVVSSDSLGRFDSSINVEFADLREMVPCRIASRAQVHPRVTLFELEFALAPTESERIADYLTRCSLPYPPQTDQWMRHVA